MKLNLGSLSFLTLFIFKIDLVFQGPLHSIALHWTSLVAQLVKNLLAMRETQETQVRSWGWEDPLEEEMATQSSILAWKILWKEEPGGLQSMG